MAWEMNEADSRVWVRKILEVVREGCTLTNTTVDESVVDMCLAAVDSPLIWPVMWRMLDGLLDRDVVPITTNSAVMQECGEKGINPLIIIQIVQALLALWNAFRPKA